MMAALSVAALVAAGCGGTETGGTADEGPTAPAATTGGDGATATPTPAETTGTPTDAGPESPAPETPGTAEGAADVDRVEVAGAADELPAVGERERQPDAGRVLLVSEADGARVALQAHEVMAKPAAQREAHDVALEAQRVGVHAALPSSRRIARTPWSLGQRWMTHPRARSWSRTRSAP